MFVPGRSGEAFDLGRDRWLEYPQPEVSTAGPRALTVTMWVNLRSFPAVHAALATRQLGSAHEDQFFFGLEGEQLRVSSHAWKGFLRRPAPIQLGRWFHAAYVHDQRSGRASSVPIPGSRATISTRSSMT